MITYTAEIRVVKQEGCRISYWGLLLVGIIACFLFFNPYPGIQWVSTVVRWSISRVLFSLFATDFEGPCP